LFVLNKYFNDEELLMYDSGKENDFGIKIPLSSVLLYDDKDG